MKAASSPSSITERAASAQCTACTSRRPPRPSFTSGSSKKAASPARACRLRTDALNWANHLDACFRHIASDRSASSSVSAASPAMWRTASIDVAVSRSEAARFTASPTDRTAWPSLRPSSHTGYHNASATSATSAGLARPDVINTTSMSLCGDSSRRPYPPTATRAYPDGPAELPATAASNSPDNQASVQSLNDRHNAEPVRDSLASTC